KALALAAPRCTACSNEPWSAPVEHAIMIKLRGRKIVKVTTGTPQGVTRVSHDAGWHEVAFVLHDEGTGDPLPGRRYRLRRNNGEVIEGVTDSNGHVRLAVSKEPELLTIEIP